MTLASPETENASNTLSRAYAWISASHRRAVLFLIAACLCLFLPAFASLQPMDRDEPRFAQATKQMLETGDFVRIRFQDTARNNKPVGIYWLQSASVKAGEALGIPDARRTIWLYRIPSLLGAIAAVLLTYWAALAFVPSGQAMLAALLLASTVLMGVEARLAKTDAVLLATIVAAMGAFARIYLYQGMERPWRLPLIFWTAIGIGLTIKGPITPLVPLLAGCALAIMDRGAPWLSRLKAGPGIVWALLIALPWFVLIMIETKGGFLADSVGKDMLGKIGSGKEGHGAPPLTYFAAFWLTAWPMPPFAALVAPWAWSNRRSAPVLFLLAWLIPLWIMFEIVPTKLPHYVLPVYPAIAILIALGSGELYRADGGRWRRYVTWLLPIIAGILLVAGAGLAVFAKIPPGWSWFVFAPAGFVFSLLAVRSGIDHVRRLVFAVAAALGLFIGTFHGILVGGPGRMIALSPEMARAARGAATQTCKNPALASTGYYEPSLVFLTRTDIVMGLGEVVGRFIASGPCRLAFVEARQEGQFRQQIQSIDGVRLISRIKGRNLNGGRALDIGVWLRQ